MASNQTKNYGLSQWELTDDVRMKDFNSDNAKIDAALAGMPMVVTGSYTGKGSYGSANPTVLTLSIPAKFILIWGSEYSCLTMGIRGQKMKMMSGMDAKFYTATWSGNKISWYGSDNAHSQMNNSGTTYYYVAVG